MEITTLQIKNYRSIKDSGELKDITKLFALIGQNNTGKSSVLKAIQVLWKELPIGVSDFHKDTDEPIEITATIKRRDKKDQIQESRITLQYSKDLKGKYFIDGKKKTEADVKKILPELLVISDIRNPQESTTEGQKNTLLKKILKLMSASGGSTPAIYSQLSEKLKDIKSKEAAELSRRITKKFQNVVGADEYIISITPNVDIEKGITHHTNIENSSIPGGKAVDILNSGTGLQSMYILALLEAWAEEANKNDEAILVIEEPEVYLHPTFQRRIFAALRRIAENNQVIYTTHSPIMISEVWATESIRQITLNEQGETLINPIKIEEVIDELGIRYEDILNPKVILFVEGESDIKFLDKMGVTDSRLKVIDSDSFRAIHYYAYIKIITSNFVTNQFRILVDSDGIVVDKRKQQLKKQIESQFKGNINIKIGTLEDKIMVLPKYSIESYFLQEGILQRSFASLTKEEITALIREYEERYAEGVKDLGAKKIDISKFQMFLKPKRIFEKIRNPNLEKEYLTFWSSKAEFLKGRDKIIKECVALGGRDINWFDHILSQASIKDMPKELIAKIEELKKLINE
ncbi:hypothetical protein ES703_03511 [subsurface metagenome]